MRHHVAKLAPMIFVGGCSLIYNPNSIDRVSDANRIDTGEVPVDVEIREDAMPRDLMITEAFPTTIDEGSGTGGARPALVVLRGLHFVKNPTANLVVLLTPAVQDAATLDSWEVAGNGDYIALAVTAPIATTCGDDAAPVLVDVTVTQNDELGQPVTKTLDDAFSVRCLDELDAAPTTAVGLKAMYSRIEIAGPLDFPAEVVSGGVILRSASGINIGAVDVSGFGRMPGPGGGLGGAAGGAGGGLKPGLAGNGLGVGGGGAGFVVAGTAGGLAGLGGTGGAPGGTTGNPWLAKYAENASSGGGGGSQSATGTPGGGGGGGGTIELTAPGNITIGALTADGAPGVAGVSGSGSGGAGTGGVVIVRAGNTLVMPSVSVAKGSNTGNGGASSDGRVRIDAAKGEYPTGATECVVPFDLAANCTMTRGPILVDPPTRTTTQTPMLTLRGAPNDQTSTLSVFDKTGVVVAGMTYSPLFGTGGETPIEPVLKAGYNKVCVWVAGGGPALLESVNCVDIAYLPL